MQEQRADIKAALDLVAGRPPVAAAESDYGHLEAAQGLEPLAGDDAAACRLDDYSSGFLGGGGYLGSGGIAGIGGWESAAPLPEEGLDGLGAGGFNLASWEAAAAGDSGIGDASPADPLASLLDAATAAADAATAWAGGYDAAAPAAAAGAGDDWGQLGDPLAAAGADAMDNWSIPAVGGSRQASPAKAPSRGSPAKRPAVGGSSKQAGSWAPATAAAASLQASPTGVPSLSAVESDIEGLESALRAALGDLSF